MFPTLTRHSRVDHLQALRGGAPDPRRLLLERLEQREGRRVEAFPEMAQGPRRLGADRDGRVMLQGGEEAAGRRDTIRGTHRPEGRRRGAAHVLGAVAESIGECTDQRARLDQARPVSLLGRHETAVEEAEPLGRRRPDARAGILERLDEPGHHGADESPDRRRISGSPPDSSRARAAVAATSSSASPSAPSSAGTATAASVGANPSSCLAAARRAPGSPIRSDRASL